MPLPKMGGEKKLEWNCGNGIAEIGEIFFLAIVAMLLPKMGGKKNCGCRNLERNLKKKKCYIYNIFTIFSQQIIGDQLLLVQI